MEISHDGRYLFTVNTGSGNISSYSINHDGSLAPVGSTPIVGGGADIDARLSPDGKYLLVDGSGMHFVSVFAVNGGSLTEVPSFADAAPSRGHLIRRDCQHLETASRPAVPGLPAARARDSPVAHDPCSSRTASAAAAAERLRDGIPLVVSLDGSRSGQAPRRGRVE